MAISQSNDSELNEELALGPGKRLREVRIARNLEVADVATRLRLHVKTINSIEADDYAHLPAPTFIRGYLRGYARLLELPCDPIVESYERQGFSPPPLVRDISKRDEIKSTDFPVRLITYAIVGILIIFVTIWWQNQQVKPLSMEAGESTLGTTAFDTDDSGTGPLPINIVDNTSGKNTLDDATVSSVFDLNDETQDTDTRNAGTVSDGSGETELVSPTMGQSEVDPNIEVATSSHEEAVGEPGVNRLEISFTYESWVEIYGKDEKMLYYNLAKPGDIIELREMGPLRVLLGYIKGVNVEFNGKPFDFGPHITAGIAKFTLQSPPTIAERQLLPQSSRQQ